MLSRQQKKAERCKIDANHNSKLLMDGADK